MSFNHSTFSSSSSSIHFNEDYFNFLLFIISSLLTLPACLFFAYVCLRGIFVILRSMHHAFIKSSLLIITLIATFMITYYYFLIDNSFEILYDFNEPKSLFHLQVTSSHTLCLLLGISTAQWVRSHNKLSLLSQILFTIILLSIFFIGCLIWFYFFFQHACELLYNISILPVTIPQACSSSLSHWLSFIIGICMLHDYYRRGFHNKGSEKQVLQYYLVCGIALACFPQTWQAFHTHFNIQSENPLMSPSLWGFFSIFLISFVSIRRLSYYSIILFSIAIASLFSTNESMETLKVPQLYPAMINLFENNTFSQIFAIILTGTFIFALCAEFSILLSSVPNQKETQCRNSIKGQSVVPKRMRAKRFPPIYPNGWYRVFNSDDINIGDSKYINICGQDLAVFRGNNGKVAILDAFCPHLGANLGVDAKVKGNCIECPFHGWQFNANGICESIPYASKVPSVAKTRSWPVIEFSDMICVYYHVDGLEPDFIPQDLPEIKRMKRYYKWEQIIDMHIQDFAENAADYAHFNFVHDDLDLPIGNNLFYISHNVTWHAGLPSDPSQTRFSYFTDDTRVHCSLLPKYPFPQYVKPIVLFNGPSLIYFRFITPLGDILLLKTFQPIGPIKTHVQDRIYADKLLPSLLVRFICSQALHAFLDDVTIWENKGYSFKPLVIKEDGPMHKVRRWFNQYYTENSIKINSDNINLSW